MMCPPEKSCRLVQLFFETVVLTTFHFVFDAIQLNASGDARALSPGRNWAHRVGVVCF